MAAIILSPRVVLDDDDGSFLTPTGDGTIIDNALFQTLQDRIDNLFTRNPFTIGGTLRVEGFGTHAITAGGVGGNVVNVVNSTAGTGNFAGVVCGNDLGSTRSWIVHTSSTFTTTLTRRADVLAIENGGTGGVILAATNPGAITFTLGSPAEQRITFRADGNVGIGTTAGTPIASADVRLNVGGLVIATSTPVGLAVTPTLRCPPSVNSYGEYIAPTIERAASGTHALVASSYMTPPVVTGSGATVTQAATLYVTAAPTAGGTNFAIISLTGPNYFGGMITAAGQLTLTAPTTGNAANAWIDPATGIVWRSTSARKYKTAIAPLAGDVDKVLALEPVTFAMLDDPSGQRFPGLIADDVLPLVPLLVDLLDGAPEAVRYDRLACYLLVVVKALDARLRALEGAPV